MTTNIVFKNEPKLSEHEVDRKFNERRIALVPHVEKFLLAHKLFENKEVSVTFAHAGVSSVVCILGVPENKFVLKIPLSLNFSKGEALFLEVWEKVGARVPHIFETGVLNGHAYILMEYIDALTLLKKYSSEELVANKIFIEIGSTLRKMHIPKAQGFGRVMDEGPEFKTFKEWLQSEDIQERILYVHEHSLLNDEHGSIILAQELLLSEFGDLTESNYCHEDLGLHNIFATEPIIIFDPNPRFNLGIWDLTRAILTTIWQGHPDEVRNQLFLGYFNGEKYNIKILHAALILNVCFKLPYSHKTNKAESIKNIQEYLIKTKRLME